jgi:hypothetical protein
MKLAQEHLLKLGLPERVSRRLAVQWVMAAVAASAMPDALAGLAGAGALASAEDAPAPGKPVAGYGVDPKLTPAYQPGAFWPLTMTPREKETAQTLSMVIIPEDEFGPSAPSVGVVEMIDEWISAPYPRQQADRAVILEGFKWLDEECLRRHGDGIGPIGKNLTPEAREKVALYFSRLSIRDIHEILDDICYEPSAKPELKKAAEFFERFRSLCASAYYATPQGWAAIGYVGNVALERFDGPPAEVLEKLGVTQTVK